MKLKQVVNLKNWHQRHLSVGYGTRDKTVIKRTKKGKVYFLAKTYDKDIGELRSEVCASSIGRLFGFPVQNTWLCRIPQYKIFRLRHPVGVLIQLNVRRQRNTQRNQFREDMIHGASLISLVSKTFASFRDEKERRMAYTLSIVVKSIRNYVERHPRSHALWDQFFELLAFDALIGGTDRHYHNWAVLEKADNGEFIRLAPAFDNGVSLMWKIDEYRPQFMKDLFMRNFPKRAESMFKRDEGGKYSLYEVLEALYQIGDYGRSNIARTILDRIKNVKISKIRFVIFNNVPQRAGFRTKKEELNLICEYVKVRLDLLKEALSRLT